MIRGRSRLRRAAGVVAITLATALPIAACGSNGSGGSASGSSRIVIRVSAPLSGPAAVYGQLADGFSAYMKSRNAAGGIEGIKVDIKAVDNVESPDGGATTMLSLLADDPDVLVVVGSTPTNAGLQVIKSKKAEMPVFALANGAIIAASGVKTAYGMYPDYLHECYFDTQYLVDTYHPKKIALVYEDDPVGQAQGTDCPAYGKALGVDVTAIPVSATTTDFNVIAAKARATGATAAMIYGLDALSANVIKASASLGFEPEWMTFSGTSYDSFIKLLGSDVDGVLVSSWMKTMDESSTEATQLHDDLKKYAPDSENYLGASGWTLGALVAHNLEAAIKANGGKIPSAADLNTTIQDMDVPEGLGMSAGELAYDGAPSPMKELAVLQVKGGTLVKVAEPATIPTALP